MMAFLKLFLAFFITGAITFGGGYAMLPMIQNQVQLNWGHLISATEVANFVAVSESTPGPFAVNMATYVGAVVGGQNSAFLAPLGALFSTLGLVMPSFLIIIIVAKCYEKFKKNTVVSGCMTGLKPAVVGLIGGAVVSVLVTVFFPNEMAISFAVLKTPGFYVSLATCGVMTFLAFRKVHPIVIVLLSAAVGIVAGYLGAF